MFLTVKVELYNVREYTDFRLKPTNKKKDASEKITGDNLQFSKVIFFTGVKRTNL